MGRLDDLDDPDDQKSLGPRQVGGAPQRHWSWCGGSRQPSLSVVEEVTAWFCHACQHTSSSEVGVFLTWEREDMGIEVGENHSCKRCYTFAELIMTSMSDN